MFDTKNMPYFLFGYTVLIVILIVLLIIRQYKFEKSFAHGKVKVISRIEIDAITGDEIVVLSLVNKSFNNVEIKGFGFKHFNQDYDYMHNYRIEKAIKPDDKLYIAARDTLEVRINLDGLKIKLNSSNIKKFRAYAIDVYGNYVITKAKYVEKYIELFFKKAEFVAKVNSLPNEKQAKYYDKQRKLDDRVTSIINKSIETKLKNAEQPIVEPKVEPVVEVKTEPIVETVEEVLEPVVEETVVEEVVEPAVVEEVAETVEEPVIEDAEEGVEPVEETEIVEEATEEKEEEKE